ncbi:hypothetical protein LZC95_38600 [Pendulispora brunnea]|uniref:RCC1-like domain-containing protein n=1 Tax=Pendulispora brunnea TaxID=2905690 RepID=A0ABZ2K0U2_9BACT
MKRTSWNWVALSCFTAATGCVSPNDAPREQASVARSPLVEDIQSMTRRDDGAYDVTCTDGRQQIRTAAQIRQDRVCEPMLVSAGTYHSCGVGPSGYLACWGSNYYGALGNGTNEDSLVPVRVTGIDATIARVSVGAFASCAVTAAGAAKCWGSNLGGLLGNGANLPGSRVPVDVRGLESGTVDLSMGTTHACAVTSTGAVKCWGSNFDGALGSPGPDSSVPVTVPGLESGAVAVSVGGHHACALTSEGSVQCWGDNSIGQLGDGSTTSHVGPVTAQVLGSSYVSSVTAGAKHTCAALLSGDVLCWGNNSTGQLGAEPGPPKLTPVDTFIDFGGARGVWAGGEHTCTATNDGAALCWGEAAYGRLGRSSTSSVPGWYPSRVYALGPGVVTVSAGGFHTCAVLSGGIKCWGYNGSGQLGIGTTENSPGPAPVTGL